VHKQGSVVTHFRCDRIFNDSFIANFQEIVKVKKFVNRSIFDEVMPKILFVRFFPDTVYIQYIHTKIYNAQHSRSNVLRAWTLE